MEHIRLPQPEHDKNHEDDPYKILIAQQEKKRDDALKIIEEKMTIASAAQNVIDGFENESAVPTLVLEVATIGYEDDIYYSSEKTIGTTQYSVRSDSLDDALSRLAHHINPDGTYSTNRPGYRLNTIGIAFGAASYQALESDDSYDYVKIFQEKLYKSGRR